MTDPAARVGRAALTLALWAGTAVGLGACFVESAQPSSFRFECAATDECIGAEVCSNGLCQQPCGAGEEACGGGSFCLNGFCSNLCPVGDDVCPTPQECVGLAGPEAEPGSSGVCTILCDEDSNPCGDGQLCLLGLCATTCVTADDCGADEVCTEAAPGLSVCAPSDSGSSFP